MQASLAAGANIEGEAYDGLTPLDAAAKDGHLEAVKFLVNHGAAVNGVGHSPRTALGLAAVYEHTDCALYLASRGGEVRSTPEWRQGLLDALQKDGKSELYDLVKHQTK
ncbi:MAG: ankyrin repeat domain-containing protein [Proteobacteria bacterium]|nr:ankyrin repeat domain-containing protein [Pseudomonadota bacterium]